MKKFAKLTSLGVTIRSSRSVAVRIWKRARMVGRTRTLDDLSRAAQKIKHKLHSCKNLLTSANEAPLHSPFIVSYIKSDSTFTCISRQIYDVSLRNSVLFEIKPETLLVYWRRVRKITIVSGFFIIIL